MAKNKKTKKLCKRDGCEEPGAVRINGEQLCSKHSDEELRNLNEHREPRLVKMKAIDENTDLRTVLARAGFRT